MKWKKGTFLRDQSALDASEPPAKTKGWISDCGVWGIRDCGGDNRPVFAVTHIPTGLAAIHSASRVVLQEYCRLMNEGGEWSTKFKIKRHNGLARGSSAVFKRMAKAHHTAMRALFPDYLQNIKGN